jgi:hypothetical protein
MRMSLSRALASIPALRQDLGLAWLEAGVVVVADLWFADRFEGDWDGLWHFGVQREWKLVFCKDGYIAQDEDIEGAGKYRT